MVFVGKEREKRTAFSPGKETRHEPLEDRVLKMGAMFFGQELLPYLGISGKVKRIAPTEQVHLEMKGFIEDFNFEMEDGTWRHLEFESDRITKEDLMRFRSYEAITGYYYNVEVITCVVCTAGAEVPKRELIQGINTYRVEIIRLKDGNADEIISELEYRQEGECLGRTELVPLLLTPLMSGEMIQTDRIHRCLRILHKEREKLDKRDLLRMESVLYALAMKFLSKTELNELEEVFHMTILGQMLEERGMKRGFEAGREKGFEAGREKGFVVGREEGREEGRIEGIAALILDNLEDGKSEAQILGKLIKRFSLNPGEAKQYFDKYAINADNEDKTEELGNHNEEGLTWQ